MDDKDYIGKPLKFMVKHTQDYAINFFMIYYKRKIYHLKDILNNEEILSQIVKSISLPYPDYTMYIDLE